jgi:hypothetical protein
MESLRSTKANLTAAPNTKLAKPILARRRWPSLLFS